MTQVFVATSQSELLMLAAAIDGGLFDGRAGGPSERLLLACNDAPVPEIVRPLEQLPAGTALQGRFDRVVSYNEVIAPYHPGSWQATRDDVAVVSRLLRAYLGLTGEPGELVLPSLWRKPAQAVAALFPDTPISAYSSEVGSYGPTPQQPARSITSRTYRLLHLDLLPGLAPLLLSEHGIAAQVVPGQAWLDVVAEVAAAERVGPGGSPTGDVLMLGEPLATNEGVTADDEERLLVQALQSIGAAGHRRVAYAADPQALPGHERRLRAVASEIGAQLVCLPSHLPVECWYAARRPTLVVGFMSSSLVTAAGFFGIEVARTGTKTLLQHLTPYQHSNRTALTIVDACVPPIEGGGERRWPAIDASAAAGTALQPLLHAVAYCMQSQDYPHLRPAAEQFLDSELDARARRYFRVRRLTALQLPGGELPAG